jgi:hypothetical protein
MAEYEIIHLRINTPGSGNINVTFMIHPGVTNSVSLVELSLQDIRTQSPTFSLSHLCYKKAERQGYEII